MGAKRLLLVLSILMGGTFSLSFGSYSREVIDVRTLGIAPDSGIDIVPALRTILADLKANPRPAELRFEKGRYDIYAPDTEDAFSYALMLDGINGLSINGCGARFVCHGRMRVFTFSGCDNILLRNMSFDWERPLVSQGTILGYGPGFLDVSFDKERYPFRITDSKAFFYGDAWVSQVVPDSYSTLHEPDGHIVQGTKDMFLSSDNSLFRGDASEISSGVIRFYGRCDNHVPVGSRIVLYHGRYMGGVFTFLDCDGIDVKDITINHSSGMGFLAQMCSDINLKRFRVVPGGDRCFSAVADAVHLNLCRGKVLLSECEFDCQGDDALNVHGRYFRVDSISADRQTVALSSKWGKMTDCPRKGDRVWFVATDDMRRSERIKVIDVKQYGGNSVTALSLASSAPPSITAGSFVENADRFPDILVEKCHFGGGNRARGILLTSPGKTVVRNNVFRSSGSAILIEGDTDYWFESGAVRDVDIRDNVFDNCGTSASDTSSGWGWGEAPITISPSYIPKDSHSPAYHRRIRIRNNSFRCFDNVVLYARSVDGLVFTGNTVERTTDYEPIMKQRASILTKDCRNVKIRNNVGLSSPAALNFNW